MERTPLNLFDGLALILGLGLLWSGIRAIRRRHAEVPETIEDDRAVALGCLWITLGLLCLGAGLFDWPWLKGFFRIFLETTN